MGYGPIAGVEVSADRGMSWQQARLLEPQYPLAWVPFELPWTPSGTGTFTLASRAIDELGNVQPESVEWNRMGYHMNAIYAFSVQVE